MIIYQGNFLQITFEEENSLFIQFWSTSPNNLVDFKSEMLAYISFYKKYSPKYALWLHQNFSFEIDSETKFWIEKNINEVGKKYGNEKIAFVVSKDIVSHIDVINTFEETKSILKPKHFSTEKEARNWLSKKNEEPTKKSNNKSKITFDGVDDSGNPVFKFNSKSNNITDTIKFFNSYLERDKIIEENQEKFNTLTQREIELLKLFVKGKSIRKVSEALSISIHTTRTHWRNIKNKLKVKENNLILQIANMFIH